MRSKTPQRFVLSLRKIHPCKFPSPPTKIRPTDKGREFVEAHAFNHRVQILCAISSIARAAVHRDSIKTVILRLPLQIIVRGRQLDEKRRRRRFIQVHVTARAAALSELAHPQQMCQRPLCSLGGDLRTNPADLFLARRQNLRWPIRGIRRSIRTPDVNLLGSGIGISVHDSWTEVNVQKRTPGSRGSCGGIRANLSHMISPNATALCIKDTYSSFIFMKFTLTRQPCKIDMIDPEYFNDAQRGFIFRILYILYIL